MNDQPGASGYFVIGLSFLIAMILPIIPWPKPFDVFQPSWLSLVLIYWTLALPDKVNIGSGFVLGIIWDLTLGATLGIRTLALSLLGYSVACYALLLRNLALWQQAVIITFLTLVMHTIIFWMECIVAKASFHPQIVWSSLLNGLLWPWLFLLLRKVRRQCGLR